MGRVANVFFYDALIGELSEKEGMYIFQYKEAYVLGGHPPISVSLPVTTEPYVSKSLHGFFYGLIAEGWLKKTQIKVKQIHPDDIFSLLVENGKDLIGAVTLELQNMP